MKDKTHERYARKVNRTNSILKKYQIAVIKRDIHPDFSNPRFPIYAEAEMEVYNYTVLRNLIAKLNQTQIEGHHTQTQAELYYSHPKQTYCIRIIPDRNKDISDWLTETETLLSRIDKITEDLRQKAKHSKPKI